MPPRCHGSAGYRGVRPRPSGRFSAEISHEGIHWYLRTFETAELAARVYDAAAWRLGRRPAAMNFDDVGSLEDADFVAPKFEFIDIDERERREAQRRQRRQRAASVIDEAAMDELRHDHPELVRAELDFYAARKKMKKTSDGAGPSNAAPPPAAVRADDEDSHTSDFDMDYWNKSDDGSDDCSSEFNWSD